MASPRLLAIKKRLVELPLDTKNISLKNYRLTEVPEEVWRCVELQELNLRTNQITILPEKIGQLEQLEVLSLNSNKFKSLPASIGSLKQLKQLNLAYCELTQLPESLANCQNLEYINLDNNAFHHFPRVLLQLPQLKHINLANNNLTVLPKEMSRLIHLEKLFLANNLLETLPESLVQLKQLETLTVDGNPFKDWPKVLFHLGKLQPPPKAPSLQYKYSKIATGLQTGRAYFMKAFFAHLMHQFEEEALGYETRKNLFAIFQGKPEKLVQVPKSYFWQAMQFKNKVLNQRAKNFLYQEQESKLANHPLNKSSEVVLLGDFTSMTKTRFKEKLKRNDIKYSIRVKPTTTHIILNFGVRNIQGGATSNAVFITEAQLHQFLTSIEDGYLSKVEEQSPLTDSLTALLLSNDEANLTLALEMMHNSGFPKGLINELFIAGKIGATAKARKTAMKFLSLQVSPTSKHHLNRRFPLEGSDRRISKSISYYNRNCPELSDLIIATYLFKRHRKGLHYILQHAKDEERNSFVKENIIFGNELKINDIQGFSTISRTLLGYTTITHLNLKGNSFRIIPKQLHKFPDLTKLDLSHNCLKEVSKAITKAPKLTHLNLNNNDLRSMPNALYEMKYLQWINLTNNPFSDVRTKNTGGRKAEMVKQKLQQALPNCEILI
ncbi:MAG: leucine-rich repeat domain-containing protein [Chitinophagales bacterium]